MEVQRENPEMGLEEYQEMNHEREDVDQESDMDEGAVEVLSEPYPLEAIPNQHAEHEDLTNHLRSLEEEVITPRWQLIKVEAKAALVDQRVQEATREMSEMVGDLILYLGI